MSPRSTIAARQSIRRETCRAGGNRRPARPASGWSANLPELAPKSVSSPQMATITAPGTPNCCSMRLNTGAYCCSICGRAPAAAAPCGRRLLEALAEYALRMVACDDAGIVGDAGERALDRALRDACRRGFLLRRPPSQAPKSPPQTALGPQPACARQNSAKKTMMATPSRCTSSRRPGEQRSHAKSHSGLESFAHAAAGPPIPGQPRLGPHSPFQIAGWPALV